MQQQRSVERALLAGAVVVMTATCLVVPLTPQFCSVAAAGLVGRWPT